MTPSLPLPLSQAASLLALPALQARSPEHDWVVLQADPDATRVWRFARDNASPVRHELPLGYGQLATQYLSQPSAGAGQVEQVIELVEDQIMPLTRSWPAAGPHLTLLCSAPDMAALVAQLPDPQAALQQTDTIEQLFNRYANHMMGGSHSGLQLAPAQAALLILLRECLHHWGCQQVAWQG
jgi:hypothetical protein